MGVVGHVWVSAVVCREAGRVWLRVDHVGEVGHVWVSAVVCREVGRVWLSSSLTRDGTLAPCIGSTKS